MASNDKAAHKAEIVEGQLPYTATVTLWINNRGEQLLLEEGKTVHLFEYEANVLIPLGYLEAPEPPEPEARKGVKQKPITPEDRLEEPETR